MPILTHIGCVNKKSRCLSESHVNNYHGWLHTCGFSRYTHNWWHTALCELEQGEKGFLGRVLEIYDNHIWVCNDQADCSQVFFPFRILISSFKSLLHCFLWIYFFSTFVCMENFARPSITCLWMLKWSQFEWLITGIDNVWWVCKQDCLNALGLLLRLDVQGHHNVVDARIASMEKCLLNEV